MTECLTSENLTETVNDLPKVLSNIQFTWLSRKIKASLQSHRLHQKNCFNNNTILKRRSYSETMVNDREVFLGCFCYSWEIIQRFLLELSAFSLYIDKTCVTDVFSKSPLLNTDTMAYPLGVRINQVPPYQGTVPKFWCKCWEKRCVHICAQRESYSGAVYKPCYGEHRPYPLKTWIRECLQTKRQEYNSGKNDKKSFRKLVLRF